MNKELLDSDAFWHIVWEKVKSTLGSEQEKSRIDRYFSCVTSHVLENECYLIGVPEQIQADLFAPLYTEQLEKALGELGVEKGVKVKFIVEKASGGTVELSPNVLFNNQSKQEDKSNAFANNIGARPSIVQPTVRTIPSTMPLHENYTFENFVRGPSNSFAHAAAKAVAKGPGRTSYNPLFIYGGTGLGKTHLMEAIGHQVLKENPSASVCYITSETFLNEYVNAIANDSMPTFRERYRNVDVFLLDDVQFIAGKKQFQEEFFNTFSSLMLYHKQIVMTSDVAPKDIKDCEERLIGRFQQGMAVEIESPTYETRLAILKFKAHGTQHVIPDDILNYIAENIRSHVRAIEGALLRVVTFMDVNPGLPLTLDILSHLLKDSIEEEETIKDLTVNQIIKTVAEFYNVTVEEIASDRRTQTLVTPRQVAMFLSRKLTSLSFPEIAKVFDKTHATVHHGMQAIQKRMDVEPELRRALEQVTTKLGRKYTDITE